MTASAALEKSSDRMLDDEAADLAQITAILKRTLSGGARGRVTELLEAGLGAARAGARVYACGPNAMLARCAGIAAAHSLRCEVALENRMACGFGVCLGCAVPRAGGGYALVCRDGPPFDARELDWEGLP